MTDVRFQIGRHCERSNRPQADSAEVATQVGQNHSTVPRNNGCRRVWVSYMLGRRWAARQPLRMFWHARARPSQLPTAVAEPADARARIQRRLWRRDKMSDVPNNLLYSAPGSFRPPCAGAWPRGSRNRRAASTRMSPRLPRRRPGRVSAVEGAEVAAVGHPKEESTLAEVSLPLD